MNLLFTVLSILFAVLYLIGVSIFLGALLNLLIAHSISYIIGLLLAVGLLVALYFVGKRINPRDFD